MEDDNVDADSVTASAANHSFVRLSNSFLIDIPGLVLCPLCRFLQGVALSHFLRDSRTHFRLYPRVEEVVTAARVRAAALSRNIKTSFGCLPKKYRKHCY